MPLAGYQPPARKIPIGQGNDSFTVRGLSLTNLAVLLREHFPDIDTIFEIFSSMDEMNDGDFEPYALAVISQMPGFAANVIALAAGEGSAEDAERLPVPTQIEALVAIGELTFMEVGGVKKSLETVARLLKLNQKADPTIIP